jgi:hypothetical protein
MEAFKWAKNGLQADSLLVHFDPVKPLIMESDASQYGLGAVLSHKMEDGQEHPIAFSSRTLSPAEKKWRKKDLLSFTQSQNFTTSSRAIVSPYVLITNPSPSSSAS